jgi:hypothetical protein
VCSKCGNDCRWRDIKRRSGSVRPEQTFKKTNSTN